MLLLTSLHPKSQKGICSDVSGIIRKRLINNENSKEDLNLKITDKDITENKEESLHEDDKQETSNQLPRDWTIAKDHLLDQIL